MRDDLSDAGGPRPAVRLPFELCVVLLLSGVVWLALAVTLLVVGWHADATREHRRALAAIAGVMLLGGGWAMATAIHDLRPARADAGMTGRPLAWGGRGAESDPDFLPPSRSAPRGPRSSTKVFLV